MLTSTLTTRPKLNETIKFFIINGSLNPLYKIAMQENRWNGAAK